MTPRIFWIGDSTVQFNNISTWPQCGMGQVLDLYVRPGIAVYDHARNGRSTKSFYDEGLWAPVEAALCPGDLLLMQFGHNDEKSEDPTRYAAPDQFAANLLAYAHAAQAKGALPVLITPLVRRRFEGGTLVPTHGAYPDAVRLLAAREDLPPIAPSMSGAGDGRARQPRAVHGLCPEPLPQLPRRQGGQHPPAVPRCRALHRSGRRRPASLGRPVCRCAAGHPREG